METWESPNYSDASIAEMNAILKNIEEGLREDHCKAYGEIALAHVVEITDEIYRRLN